MNSQERKKVIKDLIVSRLNLKITASEIKDDAMLFVPEEENGIGLDSVDALELAVSINNTFDVTISDDDMSIFNSVNSINDFVEKQLQVEL
ncbi:MAG: phosphopantetheine-binding protein [Chryseobacterium sp.]|uniref:acyl carrier protein n=1 Tax=Chryseobacterium sp. TaxID=1871047 RepID=UPI0025C61F6E|nr:phosphopantetheine-binding protein [Chryseobacterium sp.]MCJ7934763.1 phosphopantetheine-binding protein [Chryseobacterium sp.]